MAGNVTGRAVGAAVLALLLAACSAAPTATTVQVGPQLQFEVELAETPMQRERGLSGRPDLPGGPGMLFVYPEPAVRSFWMPDMHFPIDVAWITDDRVVAVETLQPCPSRDQCPAHQSPAPVDLVLEVPAGALDGVQRGSPVRIR